MTTIPLVVRATLNATGAITFTGNTLGLSRSATAGVPGTEDSIGAFTTISTTSKYNSYPNGTTNLYASNSSSAILTLPAGSTILYAELIWGGSYIVGSTDLSAFIDKTVTLTTPAGSFSVTPDSATKNEVYLGSNAYAYVRSANVTSIVQQGGAGTYTTGGVVGTIVITDDPTANHAGWTLGVIYQNASLPFRNMSLRAGAVLVQATSSAVNTTITGFATPISGTVGGRALFSAQEGDANRTGDRALFGPTTASLTALSGPNNFAANFFASQINNDSGQLDTTGTFGNRNQTNGAPGTNISGGRQGWDITNVDISSTLVNNQSSAVLQLTTSGDAYVVNANAIQIDINSPKISVVKSASVTGSIVGDTITYTVTVSNTGNANAASVVVSDALSENASLVAGSVTVGGVSRPTYDITAGVPIGSLAFGSSATVTYRVRINTLPATLQLPNQANAAFTFQSVAGGSVISGVIPSNTVTIPVYSPRLSLSKSASTSNATVGSTVTYTIAVVNSGNIGTAVTLKDNIPAGSTYVAGSFQVNGTAISGANPATGVAIGTVSAGSTSTVTFQVLVNSLPSPPQLVDQATASFTYQPPDGRTVSDSAASNTVTIPVTLPSITVTKSSSLPDASVGDVLTYSFSVANTGLSSVSSVRLTDQLPSGSSFVAGSVTVGGAARSSDDPASGISLGSIAPGGTVTATLQIRVTSVPSPAQLSNQASVTYSSGTFNGIALSSTVTTPIYQPVIAVTKSANTSKATVGDTIQYQFTIANSGNIAAQATLTDSLPNGTSFVANSVTVGGTPVTGVSPQTGIPAGSIPAGGSTTVAFSVVLNGLPSPPLLTNRGTVAYSFQLSSGRTLSGASQSNTLNIPASSPNVNVNKAASSADATLGDILIYTIFVANNGTSPVTNVVLSDDIPGGSSFIEGSVTVRGASVPSANPASLGLGSIAASETVAVTFQTRVVQVPSRAELDNQAVVSFRSGSFLGSVFSNTVATPVLQPVIGVVKSANTEATALGSAVAYTIQIANTGNAPATVTVTDNIPAGSTFITNSVIVNGNPLPQVTPSSGIPAGTINPGSTAVVTFGVTVSSLPTPQRLVNQAVAAYTYNLSNGRIASGSSSSNTVAIPVSVPNVSVVVSEPTAAVVTGDTITYTATVTNNGPTSVNNVIVTTVLSPGTAFVPGSVIVNGSPSPLSDPVSGIPISSLAPGATATVTYEVKIQMPTTNQITNQSTVSFTSGTFSGSSSSNTVITPVTQPEITLIKSASTANATLGNNVVYTVVVRNSGNLPAVVTLTDSIPAETAFVPNSVVVGGVPQPQSSPVTGIAVGMVNPNASVTVSFALVINTLPNPQYITNQASASYTFTPPDGRTLTGSAVSNTVTVTVSAPNVGVVKNVNTDVAVVGDTLTYSTTVTNAGIDPIQNVLVIDTPPPGTVFVPGSVAVNGVTQPDANPSNGVSLTTIAAGSSGNVTFSVRIPALPSPATITNQSTVSFTSGTFSGLSLSNSVASNVYQPILSAVKSANTTNATVGDTVVYSVAVSNTGNIPAALTFSDTIPAGSSFVPNSVIINSVPLTGVEPTAGFPAGTVAAGARTVITFSVVIDSLPTPQQLSNQATVNYSFTPPDAVPRTGSIVSNTVTFPVSAPDVIVVKSTTATDAVTGDVVLYSIVVTNSGIAPVNNVRLVDPIPEGSQFVPDSVTVGAATVAGANPATGIPLDSIAPGGSVTVTFRVTVTSILSPDTLNNRSSVSFTSGTFSGITFSNSVAVPLYQPIINVTKSASENRATVGDTIVYTINVSNTGNLPAQVTVFDAIPAGAEFVPNSVIVNGSVRPGVTPDSGINIGTVSPGQSATVLLTLQASVATLPASQQLVNQATANFTFTPPDGRTLNGSSRSNTVTVPVSSPDVSVLKSTTATDAVVGDTLTYSVTVTNSGFAAINNAVLTDPVPAGTQFVPGSATVSGSQRATESPLTGIQLGTIAAGSFVIVTFQVNVTSLPSPSQLNNLSYVSYTSGTFSGTSVSNTVTTPVYQPIISVVKSANTSNVTVGNTVTYTLAVTNSGNLPASVTLTDPIPVGTVFVDNSVVVNGVPQPGANPAAGVTIGTVAPGQTFVVRTTFQVNVDTLPESQQLVNQATASYAYSPPDGRTLAGTVASNTLTIAVSSPDVTVAKSTNAVDAVVGDTLTYTVVVTNQGIDAVNNVLLVDPVPLGARFIPGTVIVDSSSRTSDDPNTGIAIGTIAAGGSSTVTFEVTVV